MKKRGDSSKKAQVTMFIILGIVILVIVVFLFMLRDLVTETVLGEEGTKRILSTQVSFIQDNIKKCIDKETKSALELLGKQGGTFNPESYIDFYGNQISYLCHNIPNTNKCLNNMLVKTELEQEIDSYLGTRIKNCINIEQLRNENRYHLSYGDFNLKSSIGEKTINILIEYPITLERKGITVEFKEFSKSVNIPLGEITTAVNDILNGEAAFGEFDQFAYDMANVNKYFIEKKRVFPDKIYMVKTVFNDYRFWFAVQGER